ncbi:MAG: hypothetical protein PHF35_04750 [Candidatus Moranbacteria bacterium]|nr:hypothetical protein [Candidatus Moranbacteria bacterium]
MSTGEKKHKITIPPKTKSGNFTVRLNRYPVPEVIIEHGKNPVMSTSSFEDLYNLQNALAKFAKEFKNYLKQNEKNRA